jgi:hypothetical protein
VTDAEKTDRRLSGVFVILLILTGLSVIAIFATAIWILSDDDTFQPIEYSTVNVVIVETDGTIRIPQVDGFEAPSVLASDRSVPFLMELCNADTQATPGNSITDFVNDETGDRYRFIDDGQRFDVAPGCQQVRFTLEMPRDMLIAVDNQTGSRPDDALSFHMEGSFNLDDGGTSYWQSESYLVVDDDPTIPGD